MTARAYPVVLEWIERLEDMQSVDEVWQSFLAFSRRYGYGFGAIINLPSPRWRSEVGVRALTLPAAWSARYDTSNYVRRDPSVRALYHTRVPYTWAEALMFENYGRPERNIVFEAAEHGLHSGFVVPIASGRTGSAVVSVAGEEGAMSKRERSELHFAAIYAHARIRELTPADGSNEVLPELSPRERECLEWVAMGKSDWEIGEILSIAERTAGAHIERAKQKLGVATRVQAVVYAIQCGAISI